MLRLWRLTVASCLLMLVLSAAGQQPPKSSELNDPCALPLFSKPGNQVNLFNDQQEEWLGEVMDQTFRKQFHVLDDPDGYLQKLGERMVAQLPPSQIHYRFFLVDAPEVNSFSMPGGRIYIFRKIISFTQNEDELAALLGHEVGHIATHQAAIEVSTWMRELGINQVGDRQDVIKKWNFYVDNASRVRTKFSEKHEQEEQLVADRVGLYAMTRAGYDPGRTAEFLDRLLQTKGKTGGFWSDLFGHTTFGSKRLRELMRNTSPMPKECIRSQPADSGSHFAQWQKAVLESKVAVNKEDVPGMLAKTSLNPALRGDLQSIQFSPNGAYVLAQDESSVFVLSREPLANLFRIDAPDAFAASFAPDSQSIVFYDKEYRVEKWDVATRQRTSIHQITLPIQCLQTALSPTGEVLVCINDEFELQLIDVAKNSAFYSHKKLYQPSRFEAFFWELLLALGGRLEIFHTAFSPDARYVLVGHGRSVLAYDFVTHDEVKLPRRIQELAGGSVAFLAPDEIAAYERRNGPSKIIRARFSSGDVIDEFPMNAGGELAAVPKGNYLLILHGGTAAVGVVDLQAKKAIMGYKSPAFAIYDTVFAGEAVGGELGLFNLSDKQVASRVVLPESPLGYPRAVAFSPNGKWLAVSGPTRGGVWKLEAGERAFYTLGFEGAYFDQDSFIAKFPPHEKNPSRIFQFNPVDGTTKFLYPILSQAQQSETQTEQTLIAPPKARIWQAGGLLLTLAPEEKNSAPTGRFFVTVTDVRSNTKLWEQRLQKGRAAFFPSRAGRTLTLLIVDYESIKAEAKEDPAVQAKLQAIEGSQGKRDSYLLRVFDSLNGKNLGAVLVDTGNLSFKVVWAVTIQDTVLVGDSVNRTLVYSLKSGQQKGKVFGHPFAISNDGTQMLVENEKGVADLYDIATLRSLARYTFSSRIIHADFTEDGRRLMVLTADQKVYQLNAPGSTESAKEQTTP